MQVLLIHLLGFRKALGSHGVRDGQGNEREEMENSRGEESTV